MPEKNILFLFDVDGTLSESRCKAPEKILKMLKEIKKYVNIAFVGGSDLEKQKEQIGNDLLNIFTYGFPENGVQFYKKDKLISESSFIDYLGEENYKKLVNRLLFLLSEIDCPKKRGNFIECRRSMINVSPIGRTCTREERLEFFEFDKKNKIREKIKNIINEEFKEMKVVCSIGGQISIDIFLKGWDKTYCLNHIKEEKVIFFGDMIEEGGNDYEIYNHERVKGIKVTSPEETIKKVKEELEKENIKINLNK